MHEWEYLWVLFRSFDDEHELFWIDSLGRDGTMVQKEKEAQGIGYRGRVVKRRVRFFDYTPLLADRGAEGWELIKADHGFWMFKRPKP